MPGLINQPGFFIYAENIIVKIYTVSDVNKYIKNKFDDDVILRDLMLRGEISNFKVHTSGHCYFSLKDEIATIRCVAFRSSAMKFRFCPQNGMKVIASGYISVYERDGSYQFYVQKLLPEGVGELSLALEQLKQKLSAEGLFDNKYKQELPFYPKTIGVVTSRTGAVIRDICHVAKRRNPLIKIVLRSVLVQGENASDEIAEAIEFFNTKYPVDVIIVGRGGGSMEDLWAFNEERVIRAIFASKIPVISAVGHETDYSLSDLVSDVRAATPSQAAELAVPEKFGLETYVENLTRELRQKVKQLLIIKQNRLNRVLQGSVLEHSDKLLSAKWQRLDLLNERLARNAKTQFAMKQQNLILLNEKLSALNPLAILARGYGMINKDEHLIKNVHQLAVDDTVDIVLSDGMAKAKIIAVLPRNKQN